MKLRNAAAALAAAVALATLVACKPAAPSAEEITAVAAVNAAWGEHYNAGDADALAGLYWEDAALLPPGAPAVVGRDAIREHMAGDMAGMKSAGLSTSSVHGPVSISGNLAWQEGTFTVTDASGTTLDAGKYVSVLEKRDGNWRLLRDTYNSDGLSAAPAADGLDAVAVDPGHYKVEFENDRVRVLRISYGPKERSVMHSHPEGVVVFLNDTHGRFTLPDGSTQEMRTKAGTTAWTDAATHQPENLGGKPFEVIQVELK